MGGMFYGCESLTSLDLSNFNTTKVENMSWMFCGCKSLTSLDLSNFNTAKVEDISWMFVDCESLRTIIVGDRWIINSSTNTYNMFYECKQLIGGKGTTYNSDYTDGTYALIDGGPENPGYLTEVPEFNTITYLIDGEVYKTLTLSPGEMITPEPEPTKEGYTFSGWSEIPETMPDHYVIVTGHFEKVYDVASAVMLTNIIIGKAMASDDDLRIYDLNHDNELNIGDMILVIKKILNSMNASLARTTRAADAFVDLSRFTAVQFTVSVPEGGSISDIGLIGNNQNTHKVAWQQIDESNYAVVVYSNTNQMFSPENGCIMEIALSDGNRTDITTGNVILATPQGERVWLNSLPAYTTTGIEGLTKVEYYDVYDMNGRMVRKECRSINGLASGVYIINGKKMVIK
jgi:surface protein